MSDKWQTLESLETPQRIQYCTRLLGKQDKKGLEALLTRLRSIEKQSFNKEDSMVGTLHKEVVKAANRVVLAEDPGCGGVEGVVGYLIYSNNLKQEGCSRILKVAVAKASRNQGAGAALISAACDLSRAERSPAMQLHVALSRTPAHRLYLRHGFVVLSHLPDYYAEGRDAYLMEKRL